MKATEQYFPVVLFIMLYNVALTFESVNEILKCDHSKESYVVIAAIQQLKELQLEPEKIVRPRRDSNPWTLRFWCKCSTTELQGQMGTWSIAHVRYIKVQLETIDITTRLYAVNRTNPYIKSPKPRNDVYCSKLNFIISNVGYCIFFIPTKWWIWYIIHMNSHSLQFFLPQFKWNKWRASKRFW